jgi:hypothetical protein
MAHFYSYKNIYAAMAYIDSHVAKAIVAAGHWKIKIIQKV